MSTHHNRIPADRYMNSKDIPRRGVTSRQFLLLAPGRAAARIKINGTGVDGCLVIERFANGNLVATNGDKIAKLITRGRIRSDYFLLLAPTRPASHIHIG